MEKKINKSTGEVIDERVVDQGQVFPDPDDDYIITYKEQAEVIKTGEGKSDFIIKKRLVPVQKVKRSDHINSFAGDVGIENILKKVALSGDTIANVVESGKYASKQKGDHVVDISDAPKDTFEALDKVKEAYADFERLPKALRKGRSMSEFNKTLKAEEITAYIDEQVKSRLASIQKKAEEKKGENK